VKRDVLAAGEPRRARRPAIHPGAAHRVENRSIRAGVAPLDCGPTVGVGIERGSDGGIG
jgi:hypothetical protein